MRRLLLYLGHSTPVGPMESSTLVARAIARHGKKFDYSLWQVTALRERSIISCSVHGKFEASPQRHLYADHGGCWPCFTEAAGTAFFAQARAKFGLRFDYTRFKYANAKTLSTIVCPEHGAFEQSPDKHLSSKYGCPHCGNNGKATSNKGRKRANLKIRISAEDYRIRFEGKHGNKYRLDLTGYEKLTASTVVLHCPEHGESTYTAAALLRSRHGCKKCGLAAAASSRLKSYADFVTKANKVHGGAYAYTATAEASYTSRKSMLTVVCPKHGEFRKTAQKHLAGQGCWQCKVAELLTAGKLPGGYGPRFFKDNPEACNAPAVLYYLKVGSAYKIGITTHLYNRLKSIKSVSGKAVTLLDSVILPLKQAYDYEQAMLEQHKEHRTYRRWSTEVFSKDVLAGTRLQEFHLGEED